MVRKFTYGSLEETKVSEHGEILKISHEKFDATVSTFGGQVLSWHPKPYSPIFWCSSNTPLDGSKAIRGGIPICWPWFGDFQGKGNHGFARNHAWLVKHIKFERDVVELVLVLFGTELSDAWPAGFKLVQTLRFSDTFSQEITYTNIGSDIQRFSHALHNYFQVSTPGQTIIPELKEVWFDDKISERQGCPPQELRNLEGPVDRIYHFDNTVTLIDKGLGRAIEISKFNAGQWIVWNPGEDLASTMSDIHPGGEQEFVCVEAGNTNWLEVEPEQSVSFGQQIKVYNL
ncbi:D-hexose-6-phosphate mutarotase [Thalassotalea mangrovi]|uniref:Putative glucose-6-phosphate 1-epimerase n=1 Tax=Thalassotalea mangrovi TaxID=2572245 RepID=A0A4U1B391_9GAMM|nr:D-hexose-6-phosphate mutarotase [Thalassotalea mangrovi]TKB44236.1 D-hexose-6-phosphate mutarotase [Thalassotalea mangrovi]